MDRSQYLAQAIQSMSQDPGITPTQGPDLAALKAVGDKRKAFEQANPGQSYMAHGFQQMGQNIQQAPANVMAAPGNAMSAFQKLAQGFGPK